MKKIFTTVLSGLVCIIAVAAATTGMLYDKNVENKTSNRSYCNTVAQAESRGIYDFITPKVIEFYEQNISRSVILSDMKPQKLARMCKKFNVDEGKLKAIILLQDLSVRTGERLDIKQLAAMSDADLIKEAKNRVQAYAATLSDAEKEELKSKFKEIRK